MGKLLFISDNEINIKSVVEILKVHNYSCNAVSSDFDIVEYIGNNSIDIIILDSTIVSISNLAQKLKFYSQSKNILVLLLVSEGFSEKFVFKSADAFVSLPIDENIFINTVASMFKIRDSFESLSQNNTELAKSLYQLNTLYNTSYKLAGSLDKANLVEIMNDGLEKSLSYALSYNFLIDDNSAVLTINSLNALSERFEQAIKLRAVLSYNSLFNGKKPPVDISVDNIKVIKNIKYKLREYDLNIFKFDNLFAPICIENTFFGLIEVFRENEFTQEDATCFQTLTKQVSLPLESASLYEEIKETNIKLEKLEKLKSDFISIVSHELRTPLTAIKNSLDIILSRKTGDITENTDKFLNLAKRNVIRLSGIINDLLDLSKIEAEKMEFRYEKISPCVSVDFVKNSLENLAKEKGIKITCSCEPEIPFIYVDLQKMEQILTNLLSNAIKFTNENGKIDININKVLAVDLHFNTLFQEYILISVKDNGIGIAVEDQEKVFDKFHQIESSLSRKAGGTGLGLPIAKELTEAHFGKIWLSSVLNKGATFTVAVPVYSDFLDFVLNFKNMISKTERRDYPIALITIKEAISEDYSFVKDYLEDNSIISSSSKYVVKEVDSFRYLYVLINDADRRATDFIKDKICNLVNNSNMPEKYDILFSAVNTKDDGCNFDNLWKKTDNNLKSLLTNGR